MSLYRLRKGRSRTCPPLPAAPLLFPCFIAWQLALRSDIRSISVKCQLRQLEQPGRGRRRRQRRHLGQRRARLRRGPAGHGARGGGHSVSEARAPAHPRRDR